MEIDGEPPPASPTATPTRASASVQNPVAMPHSAVMALQAAQQ